MLRAQRWSLSMVTYLLAGLMVLSGFSFGSQKSSIVPTAKAAIDPSQCKIDISFVIDNSGSMDDHGANNTLKDILVPKLKNFFQDRGWVDRGALFTYSYDAALTPEGWRNDHAKQHVAYDERNSMERALGTRGNEGIKDLKFGAQESIIGLGIERASNYAREQVQTGRSQFIFVAGDNQTSGIQGVEQRIMYDGILHGIKYYTFALRKEISPFPYNRIAEISANARGDEPRFYRGNGFQDSLLEDIEKDCKPSDPNPSVKFCTRDAISKAPVKNAWVIDTDVQASSYISETDQLPPIEASDTNDDYPGLRSGADCYTNPNYLKYPQLTKDSNYTISAEAEHAGYKEKTTQTWKYLQVPGQIVYIDMDKDVCEPGDPLCPVSTITTATKGSDPTTVTPGQLQTEVSIDFNVKIKKSKPLTNIVLKEELAADMVFGATPNFRLKKPDGTTVSVSGTPNAARKTVDLALGQIAESGTYTLLFTGRYSGDIDNTFHPIDVSGSCAANAHAGSRFEFKKGDGTDGCTIVDAGRIKASDGINKITLGADVLFGNKALTLNDQLTLGENSSLIVTGQTVTGNTGTSIVFDRNNIATGGKLSWPALKTNIRSVVDRWIATKGVRVWPCPGGKLTIGDAAGIRNLYMNSTGLNPTQESGNQARAKSFTMWQLKNPDATGTNDGCAVDIVGTVFVQGIGTLVNRGGTLSIKGAVDPAVQTGTPKNVFGYVGYKEPGLADSGKVIVYDQAAIKGAIIYTEGTIEVGTADASVTGNAITPKTHFSTFIGQSMKFPSLKTLRTNITLNRSAARNAFPPFVQTYLPQSEAAP